MSNFLKAVQGSKPVSFHLPPGSIESFYSEFAKFLFLAPVSFPITPGTWVTSQNYPVVLIPFTDIASLFSLTLQK